MTERAIWHLPEFRAYIGAVGFSGVAFAMQQLLLSWILIGILELPADRVGIIQAAAGIPGLFLLLLGGASADRRDPRALLIRIYLFGPVLPLALAAMVAAGFLNVWTVLLWALGMSVVTSFSSPAQQAILNRIAGDDIQRAISASTIAGYLVQVLGLTLAGQIDRAGLGTVLIVQAACIAASAIAVRRLPRSETRPPGTTSEPAWRAILEGLRAVYREKVVFQTLLVNFASSIFNAGAFMTVVPFIVKRIYAGDAALLATVMVAFYVSASLSNVLMLRLMPIARPGRVFLILQLSRLPIMAVLWLQPPFWVALSVLMLWGLNMGVTTTLSRTIVQESAAEQFRGRVMSVYSLGILGSMPLGALVLGFVIESFGTLNALIPSMVVSTALFAIGVIGTQIYTYTSPAAGSRE